MIKIDCRVTEKFRVGYRDAFYKEQANIVSIINYFSEIAQLAGSYYDQEKNILKDESIAWIILNWDVEVERYPKYGEHVTVHTIAHSVDRFIAFREFLIYDENEVLITRGKSKWILFNVERRRPTVARDYMYDLYGVKTKEPPFELELPEQLTNTEGYPVKEYEIRKSDVDYYHHVNNAVYPLWIHESLPVELTNSHSIKRIKLYYKKEVTHGESVFVHTGKGENSLLHEVRNSAGKTLLTAETYWE